MPIIPQPIPFNVGSSGTGGAESCELFSQLDGTFDDSNTSSQLGFGVRIDSGNTSIGKTMTSFTMDLKSSNTGTSAALTFGVWAIANTSATPTAVFSGAITNNTGLTTSYVTYTFTGSRTLVNEDVIGCFWGTPTGSGVIRQQLKNPATMTDSLYVKYVSDPRWASYGATHIPNMSAFQC